VLLVSDSCYSGTLTRDAKVQKAEVLADPAAVLARRSVTVLSSGGEEPVADAGKDGHSVFAWHFMQSLKNVQEWSNGVDVYERLQFSDPRDFWHPHYGRLLAALVQAKPAVVGLDIVFPERSYQHLIPGLDQSLLKGLLATRGQVPVVLARTVDDFKNF